MKGFIEVTDYDGGMRVILPVDKITSIVCDKAKSVFIEMGVDRARIHRLQRKTDKQRLICG